MSFSSLTSGTVPSALIISMVPVMPTEKKHLKMLKATKGSQNRNHFVLCEHQFPNFLFGIFFKDITSQLAYHAKQIN